jgi:hypothetical protein
VKHLDNVVVCCFAVLGVVREENAKWHDNVLHSKPENKGPAQSMSVLASVFCLLNFPRGKNYQTASQQLLKKIGNVALDRGKNFHLMAFISF